MPRRVTEPPPPAPDDLNDVARAEWERAVAVLLPRGHFDADADRTLLTAYCAAYARWVSAEANLAEFGDVIARDGVPVPSPYLAVSERALEQFRKLAVDLGLSPTSKSRAGLLA